MLFWPLSCSLHNKKKNWVNFAFFNVWYLIWCSQWFFRWCMSVCLHTLVYIVENKQRPYVMPIVIVYKSLAVLLGDQWSLNLPLFTVWSLSVQWTAFLFSTIVPHSLKHLSLKCLQRQINCHQEFKPGNWEEMGHKGTQWIILHEVVWGGGLKEGESSRHLILHGWAKSSKIM